MAMRILITNDDGISSPALGRLAAWARGLGEVTVVAPKHEQSGKSQSIDFTRLIEIKRISVCEGVEGYSVDSTPADCVRFAMLELAREKAFDLTLSGVNRGFNLGHDIAYSGTVGAIMESARFGVPAIALSADVGEDAFDEAFSRLDEVWGYIQSRDLLKQCSLYNVNIPLQSREIRVTRRGGSFYHDHFVHKGNDLYAQEGEPKRNERDLTFDTAAVWNRYISITPMTADKTDLLVFERLKNQGL